MPLYIFHRYVSDPLLISNSKGNHCLFMVQGINEKILSLNFKEFKAEIKTADAQKSYKEGVTVLVTGCLTGNDNLRRNFAQSFFLAPQDNGYFVLNDVFRYVEDHQSSEPQPVNGDGDAAAVTVTLEPGKINLKKCVFCYRNYSGVVFMLFTFLYRAQSRC